MSEEVWKYLRDFPKNQRESMIKDEFLENAGVNVKVYRKSQEAMNKWNKKNSN